MIVVRGNLASLLCLADGTPTPSIAWLKEGRHLSNDTQVRLLNQNTTMQFPQAEVSNTGHYTCIASNAAGQASRHFNLKVLGEWKSKLWTFNVSLHLLICGCDVCLLFFSEPPQIKTSGVPAEVSVVVNSIMELQCEATGIPPPSLTWLKDGRPLPQTASVRLLQGGKVLRVASAQVTNSIIL